MIGAMLERVHAGPEPEPDRAGSAAMAPAGLPGAVLGLQRQIGNAAVTRLLQREVDTAEPVEGRMGPASDRLCATFVPSQSTGPPQRLDPEDPIIGTVAGPCLVDWAGGYYWYVTYQLPAPAQVGGFIIQELHQQGDGGTHEHFWECWRVRAGATEPPNRTNTPSDVTPAGAPYDDRYRHLWVPGAHQPAQGWYRHLGVARFYPGPLPPQFGAELPSSARTRPDGWTGAGTRHDCYAEWGRRGGQRYRGLVAYAGWREYRAGEPVNDTHPRP
jgi:hypothetical protein